ncbi:MAG: FprA family A-type flavoprotein [Anaerorhabdus sp.]
MEVIKLNENFYWLGVKDKELRVFDVIMETKYGTTYNSYLLKTNDGVVLFDTVKEKFFDEYLKKINEISDVSEIKYIICNHTEPDHSGSLEKLLALNPNIEIISSMVAKRYLSEIINKDFNSRIVKDNETILIGDKSITFYSAINLHWPDAMYSYLNEDKILVSCDSFGAHYAFDGMLLSEVIDIKAYKDALEYYTKMIMGPFKNFINRAMDKIKDLDIQLICPGHGPIIDKNISEVIKYYQDYAIEECHSTKVSIVYVSAYGYTKEIADIVAKEIKGSGFECNTYDLVEEDADKVFEELVASDVILYGSSTMLQDALPPIYNMINRIISGYHGTKKVSAFGSYGWSGEAVGNIITRLKQQRMKVLDEGLKILFKPSEANILEIRAYAKNIVDQIK